MTQYEAMTILGLTRGYAEKDLKKAYRQKSLLVHPDKGGTNEDFLKVRVAYEFLQNHKLVAKMGITHKNLFIIKEID